jgi:hypothetical protein
MNQKRIFISVVVVSLCMLIGGSTRPALAQEWIFNNFSGPPFPEPRGFQGTAAVLDPSTNRMIIFGGMLNAGLAGSRVVNDVWVLIDASAQQAYSQWMSLIPDGRPGSPQARHGHSVVYDATNNRMILFGGCDAVFRWPCIVALYDVWVLTNANGLGGTPTWIQLSPTGTPPQPRTRHTAVYDGANNRMIVFAGQNGRGGDCQTFPDVWVLTNANGLGGTPAWIQLPATGGPPPGQYSASAVYDAASNIMTVFGGVGLVEGVCQNTNAVWALTNANGLGDTPAWSNLVSEGADGSPPSRSFHTAVNDVTNNIMTIFGGNAFNDVWTLSNSNGLGDPPIWTQITPVTGNSPAGRSAHVAVYDAASNRMTVYSGGSLDGIFGVGGTSMVLTNANGVQP